VNDQIRQCPVCKENGRPALREWTLAERKGCCVQCRNCGIMTKLFKLDMGLRAIEYWNRGETTYTPDWKDKRWGM
jgi:hypothetical protein